MNEEQKPDENVILDPHGRTYILVEEPDAVVVLAKKEDALLLINQYRPAVDDFVVQLPGGGVETHETLAQAARREFSEEQVTHVARWII